ncbi:uncharacterized protein L3040_007868 [Drepanopeziza brunnea f. sp. 'multigermtubi']|uniref:uncharacterized protein n=1 Tax=Drepanopeziza brunnea f. sp. 'multigermtubi' TaxID=698441 RepID=UPI0023866AC6|nr:hypothetical protein L3040_007868 [Drepanopeziza brunnea f. sp. 'multigermtubi']
MMSNRTNIPPPCRAFASTAGTPMLLEDFSETESILGTLSSLPRNVHVDDGFVLSASAEDQALAQPNSRSPKNPDRLICRIP